MPRLPVGPLRPCLLVPNRPNHYLITKLNDNNIYNGENYAAQL